MEKKVCAACTLSLDPRAPTTMRELQRRREEVRGVLRRLRRVYDDVDGLVGADAAEAERVARAVAEREAREAAEREARAAAWEMGRAEAERARHAEEAMAMMAASRMGHGGGEHGGIGYQWGCEGYDERREGGGAVAKGHHQCKVLGRLKKKTSGLKALFGRGSRGEYV